MKAWVPSDKRLKMAAKTVRADASQAQVLLDALAAFRKGDVSARVPAGRRGAAREVAAAVNFILDSNEKLSKGFDQSSTGRTRQLLKQSEAIGAELKRANEELQKQTELLEQAKKALEEKAEQLTLASRYKSEFLANMSHELRTPLHNLLILSKTLAENPDGNLTAKQVKFADTIHTSGTDLLALINDILDLSKIESGKMEVDLHDLRLGDLEEYCAKAFRHVAEGKGIDFAVELGDGLAGQVMYTDAKWLQQVMKNLLSNALKFTERGSVKLTIDRAAGGWSASHPILSRAASVLAFAVSDTGIGIAADKQRIIFEAFQQADGTTSRKFGGTGLGLSISRELTRLLGGEIRLQSTPGEGSTFTLYLPEVFVAQAPPDEEAVEEPAILERIVAPAMEPIETRMLEQMRDAGAELAGRTILIVDSDVRNLFILTSLLEDFQLNVLRAENGREAIALLQDNPRIDLVLLDVMIPDESGYETLRAIRQLPWLGSLPVIAVNGKARSEGRSKCMKAGASECLEKPIDLEELFLSLRVWIGRRGKLTTIAARGF